MDCLLDHSSNESIGLVGGVPFVEYCRCVSPIKCINSKILRRYIGKPVKVWFIRDKKIAEYMVVRNWLLTAFWKLSLLSER